MERRLYRRMTARPTDEEHRASTPLELFFDLCFVVAVAQAAEALHHALGEGHIAHGVGSYFMVFFAVWWAWMNFTWFASAYDTDDVVYRITTLIQITGSLIIAAGVDRAFEREDFTIMVIGYVIMRAALVSQWLRLALSYPPRRTTALRAAGGLLAVQALWVLLIFLPHSLQTPAWILFALIDVSVPLFAELAGRTSWHPHHIAERYGLFTLIMLGESVGAATLAFKTAFDTRFTGSLLLTVVGAILIMSALWWLYFSRSAADLLTGLKAGFVWGYGHYLVFGSAAAVGAGLSLAAAQATGQEHTSDLLTAAAVTVPTAVFLLTLWVLHHHPGDPVLPALGGAALVLAVTFLPGAVLLTGLVLVAVVTAKELSPARSATP